MSEQINGAVAQEVAMQMKRPAIEMLVAVERVLRGDFEYSHPVDTAIIATLRRHKQPAPERILTDLLT
ncbi:MAG: hypothetical protein QOE70_4045 [Chthoniobacter sp.]|jgi:hypothetical protein|nr:hypothetical protein [Chthoniobacter sp.]